MTFGGHDTWKDETAWNYEVGSKSRIMGGRGSFNVSAFYMDINDLQATVTAGSCSSRVVFNVPKARSEGVEVEFAAAPNEHFDFSISASYNDAELQSTVTSTGADGTVSVVSGIEDGNRLPSVPEFQLAAAATYQWQMKGSSLGYVTGTYQHVGSRFTQVGDQDARLRLNLLSFGANTIGGPLTRARSRSIPELPAYDLVNLRVGVLKGKWDVALFGNNLTDERALLALDRERGNARPRRLPDQPAADASASRPASRSESRSERAPRRAPRGQTLWTFSLVARLKRGSTAPPARMRAATYSPIAGPCLKPCPEPPPTSQTFSSTSPTSLVLRCPSPSQASSPPSSPRPRWASSSLRASFGRRPADDTLRELKEPPGHRPEAAGGEDGR